MSYLVISGAVSVLFSDNIKDGLLNMNYLIFSPLHISQLGLHVQHSDLLHLQHFIIAGSVVEWIVPLSEVVHHVGRVQDGNPC